MSDASVFDPLLNKLRTEDTKTVHISGGGASSQPVASGGTWGSITGTLSNQTDLQTELDDKVDKIVGKGLSTEDYTTTEKVKLSSIATGAEVNVNADWNAVSGDAQILNKPTIPTVTTIDTKANILTLSPSQPQTALATDTDEFYIWNGTNWNVQPLKVSTELANPDAGYTQDSNKRGYGDDYIYGKKLYATGIGDFTDTPFEGAIKVDQDFTPAKYQIYLRGKWNTLFYDLTMENGDFEHVPQTYSIDVRSGNSNTTGLNGQPIIREYKVDAGAYPREVIIDGGVL